MPRVWASGFGSPLKLPDVVGVGEPGEVGGLRGAMLCVRRGGVGVPLWVDLELAKRGRRRRWGLGSGLAVQPHARGLPVRSWSDVPTVGAAGATGSASPARLVNTCATRSGVMWASLLVPVVASPPVAFSKCPAAWWWRSRCERGRPGLRPRSHLHQRRRLTPGCHR